MSDDALKGSVLSLARSLFPIRVQDDNDMWPRDAQEAAEAWRMLVQSPRAAAKLRGILLDTGDTTVRRFDRPYFDGNGPYSTLSQQVLLDRIRYGCSLRSGIDQGGLTEEEARPMLEAIVQDVAMALLGRRVEGCAE